MGKILFGVLLGAVGAFMLTAAFLWLAPFLAAGAIAWIVYKVYRLTDRSGDGLPPSHMKMAYPVDPEPEILELTHADIWQPGQPEQNFRRSY